MSTAKQLLDNAINTNMVIEDYDGNPYINSHTDLAKYWTGVNLYKMAMYFEGKHPQCAEDLRDFVYDACYEIVKMYCPQLFERDTHIAEIIALTANLPSCLRKRIHIETILSKEPYYFVYFGTQIRDELEAMFKRSDPIDLKAALMSFTVPRHRKRIEDRVEDGEYLMRDGYGNLYWRTPFDDLTDQLEMEYENEIYGARV